MVFTLQFQQKETQIAVKSCESTPSKPSDDSEVSDTFQSMELLSESATSRVFSSHAAGFMSGKIIISLFMLFLLRAPCFTEICAGNVDVTHFSATSQSWTFNCLSCSNADLQMFHHVSEWNQLLTGINLAANSTANVL